MSTSFPVPALPRRDPTIEPMTIERMDHVGIVVDDMKDAVAFFVELGLELEGEAPIEGEVVDRVIGLEGAELVGEVGRMRATDFCYVLGPAGIIVELAERSG